MSSHFQIGNYVTNFHEIRYEGYVTGSRIILIDNNIDTCLRMRDQ